MEMEREEGEITDEEFENVSDSSILNSLLLEDLSSVTSESSDEVSIVEIRTSGKAENLSPKLPLDTKKRKIDESYSRKRVKYAKHRYDTKSNKHGRRSDGSDDTSSSDSDDYISDTRILRQLRNAVCISSTRKNPNCSLRTRIKRMIEPESQPSSPSPIANKSEDDDLENLRHQALKSKTVTSNTVQNTENEMRKGENQTTIIDDDLINLRLVALQSAVLKKHKNRQKRKELQKIEPVDMDISEEILETEEVIEIQKNEMPVGNSEDIVPESELQADTDKSEATKTDLEAKPSKIQSVNSVSVPENQQQKEIEKGKETEKNFVEEDEDILRAMLLTSISRKIANKKNDLQTNKKEIKSLPKVNNNNNNNKTTTKVKPLPNKAIIKPKSPIKRIIINVNSDSESDTNNESNSPEKKKELINFEQDLSNLLKEARKKSEGQKAQQLSQSDVSKHLPKSQQIEYRKLKRKLQLLSKQNLLLKLNKKAVNNVDENNQVEKCKNLENKPSTLVKKQFSAKLDRLQMVKGKYESLVPLMNKIAKAREARDTAQNDVTRLINELKEARTRLTTTHKTYTTLIKQLQQVKAGIDERGNVLPSRENKNLKPTNIVSSVNICTSTPLKETSKDNVCDISSILPLDKMDKTIEEKEIDKDITINIVTEEIVESKPKQEVNDKVHIQHEDGHKTLEDRPVFFPDIKEDTPNDKNNRLSENFTKYNSPLEHIQTNSEEYGGNPLSVLCPYDLLGVCRDPDCAYRH